MSEEEESSFNRGEDSDNEFYVDEDLRADYEMKEQGSPLGTDDYKDGKF